MIDWTKPIRQKNGRVAVFLCERPRHGLLTKKVAVENERCSWSIENYTAEGTYWHSVATPYDLENIPEETQ